MVEDTAMDGDAVQHELDRRTLEWTRDVVAEFLLRNEAAQRGQASLPPEAVEIIERDGPGLEALVPAMMAVKPSVVKASHVVIVEGLTAIDRLLGSLSQGERMIASKTDAENGASVARDWAGEVERLEARVEQLERQRDEMRMLLAMISAMSAGGADGDEEAGQSGAGDRAVGF